ncbi:hypothetical protein DRN79_05185 [Methanosarcinales archaeon]|nr:MAG: hypothetical protein DRN79_05185 [Methanosarcinales archaeon]
MSSEWLLAPFKCVIGEFKYEIIDEVFTLTAGVPYEVADYKDIRGELIGVALRTTDKYTEFKVIVDDCVLAVTPYWLYKVGAVTINYAVPFAEVYDETSNNYSVVYAPRPYLPFHNNLAFIVTSTVDADVQTQLTFIKYSSEAEQRIMRAYETGGGD